MINSSMVPSEAPVDPVSKKMTLAIVLLLALLAAGLLIAQPKYSQNDIELSLPFLNARADKLSQITDPAQRDQYCIPLSGEMRMLDKALAPDARVFALNMVGPTNQPKQGYFYFLENYLFPRDVELALGTNTTFTLKGFTGTPATSIAQLETNGFDFAIDFDHGGIFALTKKGQLKQ